MLRCLAITGPTACGKTDLALSLADEFPLEIISMDSAMVYRGMDIGTAKPDQTTLGRVRHHLIDICDPEDAYSAGRFAEDVRRLLGEIAGRGKIGLVVGGTMLYLRALREGIAPLPARDPDTRRSIDAEAARLGWAALHARLQELDPESAVRIEPTDRQRIQRALEVHALTGEPLSALQQQTPYTRIGVDCLALMPSDRSELAVRIERRFDRMIEQGLVAELERLRQRPGLTGDSTAMRAVGYRQLWTWLDGESDFEEARGRAIAATRQLAKRQLTWLRSDAASLRFAAWESASLRSAQEFVHQHLNRA